MNCVITKWRYGWQHEVVLMCVGVDKGLVSMVWWSRETWCDEAPTREYQIALMVGPLCPCIQHPAHSRAFEHLVF